MINIDYCDSNNSYKKQVPMTASFLEGSSTTNRNKKLIIKGIIDIDYWDSNYSYKKQAPITASFSEGFYSSLKILDEACFMLKKVSQFSLTIARYKSENETFYLNYLDIVWYLFLSDKKKGKIFSEKTKIGWFTLLKSAELQINFSFFLFLYSPCSYVMG